MNVIQRFQHAATEEQGYRLKIGSQTRLLMLLFCAEVLNDSVRLLNCCRVATENSSANWRKENCSGIYILISVKKHLKISLTIQADRKWRVVKSSGVCFSRVKRIGLLILL